jgi:uncharacterized protein YndB with AHSA1/START domain
MRPWQIAAGITGALTAVFLIGGIAMPSTYTVERTRRVNAPPGVLFELVADLATHPRWSPWVGIDSKFEFGDLRAGEGALMTWRNEAGDGSYEIVQAAAPKFVRAQLERTGQDPAAISWTFRGDGPDGATVTWQVNGDNSTPVLGPWTTLLSTSALEGRMDRALSALNLRAQDIWDRRATEIEESGGVLRKMSERARKANAELAAKARAEALAAEAASEQDDAPTE